MANSVDLEQMAYSVASDPGLLCFFFHSVPIHKVVMLSHVRSLMSGQGIRCLPYTVKLQWLEHLWEHENLF